MTWTAVAYVSRARRTLAGAAAAGICVYIACKQVQRHRIFRESRILRVAPRRG